VRIPRAVAAALLLAATAPALPPDDPVMRIAIDPAAARHPISPLIYGVSFAPEATLRDLRVPVHRAGGNSASLYDWRGEARNAGRDWFFESLPIDPDDVAQYGDRFVERSRKAGAAAMLTVPMIGWRAALGADRGKRASFDTRRYGAQQASDRDGLATAGNGLDPAGRPIRGNDPRDAATPTTVADTQAWIRHLVARFGPAARGGVRFYAMDNEPSRWHDIHRDVHPVGLHAAELAQLVIDHARLVKAIDPDALIVAPEEWGWGGYKWSGFDQQVGDARGYTELPDRRDQTGGLDLLPWLLDRWRRAGHPVDVVSVHYYPQGGEFREGADDLSPAMQLRRNRSTRALWDPAYVDESWIAGRVMLIPRLRDWVDRYYRRGTPIALTEYNWGGDASMNGATAQADLLGIFGREGLDMANRWTAPAAGTPTYLAMKLFRNYDDRGAAFGDVSIAARAPDPDRVAVFAARRTADAALTIVAINKQPDHAARIALAIAGGAENGTLSGARLVRGGLAALPAIRYRAGVPIQILPPQSVTLFVVAADAR